MVFGDEIQLFRSVLLDKTKATLLTQLFSILDAFRFRESPNSKTPLTALSRFLQKLPLNQVLTLSIQNAAVRDSLTGKRTLFCERA